MRPVDSLSDLLGAAAPKAIGVLVRRFGDFAACEDAVQVALLAAATQWPVHGVPDNPTGWVVTVASRRRIELYRADEARRMIKPTQIPLLERLEEALDTQVGAATASGTVLDHGHG